MGATAFDSLHPVKDQSPHSLELNPLLIPTQRDLLKSIDFRLPVALTTKSLVSLSLFSWGVALAFTFLVCLPAVSSAGVISLLLLLS